LSHSGKDLLCALDQRGIPLHPSGDEPMHDQLREIPDHRSVHFGGEVQQVLRFPPK
jgi:hypothetical protein